MSVSKIVPNTFQCFNDYVDRGMEHFTSPELRVLIFATRHILGWQDHIESRRHKISLTMFQHGFTVRHKDGTTSTFSGCGLGRAAIQLAAESLTNLRFLIPIGKAGNDGQEWQLGEDPDWDTLFARTEEVKASNKKRTLKASIVKQSTRQGGSSDEPVREETVIKALFDDAGGSSDDMGGGSSDELNQSHIQSHKEKDSAPENGAAPIGIIPEKIKTPDELKHDEETKLYTDLFKAVCEKVFLITSDEQLKQMNAEEQIGSRIGMIASWLAGKKDRVTYPNNRKPVVFGFISQPAKPEHVEKFMIDYKSSGKTDLRDVSKFVEYWRAWASKLAKQRQQQETPKQTAPAVIHRTPEQIAAMKAERQQALSGGSK